MSYRVLQVSPKLDEDEIEGVTGAIRRNWLTEGPCAAEFVEAIKRDTGSQHAVLAPNGTLGLFLALLALDLPRDSEIIIPSFTFYASASAAVFAGLTPVFADADPDTFNIDIESLDSLVGPRTRAIMPVHIYGHATPMDQILDFAARHGLVVVEDAAQVYGVSYQGRHLGTWGDVAMISFFGDKTITTGEGAVVLTQREDLYEKLRLLRNQGRPNSGTFIHPSLGMNFRMTDLQCAVGLAQIRKLPAIIDKKLANHARYLAALQDLPGLKFLQIQKGSGFVPFRFVVTTDRREQVAAALENAGVQVRPFFYPLHLQPCLTQYARGPLPVAERLVEEGICLPIHCDLTADDIDLVTSTIREALAPRDARVGPGARPSTEPEN